MNNQVLEKKMRSLNRQVTLLRSAVLSVVGGFDTEGEYRPAFIRSVLLAARLKGKKDVFTGAENFLSKVRSGK